MVIKKKSHDLGCVWLLLHRKTDTKFVYSKVYKLDNRVSDFRGVGRGKRSRRNIVVRKELGKRQGPAIEQGCEMVVKEGEKERTTK